MKRVLGALRRPTSAGRLKVKGPSKPSLSTKNSPTAPSDHFFFPPEDGPHIRTLMAYPSAISLPKSLLELVRREILDIAHNISGFEPVTIYVNPDDIGEARSRVRDFKAGKITIVPLATHHCWTRDTGPVYVFNHNGDLARYAIDFNFNEWGGKLPGASEDDWDPNWPVFDASALADITAFSRRVIELEDPRVERIETKLTLEGGGLVSDGEGTLLATESCMLHEGRNPGWSKAEIEAELGKLLGVSKVIWFPGVKGADITDCHVDAVVGFVRPGVVIISRPHKSGGKVWTQVYNETFKILSKSIDARGRKFEIINLDEPDVTQFLKNEGDEMCASRANFYMVNGGVIVPRFGDALQDQDSLNIMKQLWPDREIRPVNINAICIGGGGIHCVTQQVPLL